MSLALRDLWRDRIYLLCNVAVIAGVLVPMLVLFGVRNGVYEALLGRLLSNPATLQIDTRGNNAFDAADLALVRGWPETAFATLKTRSLFDQVNVRAAGGRGKRDAIMVPTGPGDPMLAPVAGLAGGEVALSAPLAQQLGVGPGAMVEVATQATDRPRQLVLPARVGLVLAEERAGGRSLHAALDMMNLVEAFYDGYAIPDHGITEGRPLAGRVAAFEGMRVYATGLETLAPLQDRIEAAFGVQTDADTAAVAGVLGLGRNLALALALTASVAALGLAAALVFGFWSEVQRKRPVIAGLGLLGLDHRLLSLLPVVQALVAGVIALALSFGLCAFAGRVAERLFDTGLAGAGGLLLIRPGEAALISVGVLVFVALAAAAAARSVQRTDPAIVLREAA